MTSSRLHNSKRTTRRLIGVAVAYACNLQYDVEFFLIIIADLSQLLQLGSIFSQANTSSLMVNMVSRANALAHHILHHLLLTYKKKLFVSGCDHLVLHSSQMLKLTYPGVASP